jgi:pyruvate dehydrogenase E1 component beta subunit
MADELARDPTVFIMGEEVAQYHGAYKVTRDLLAKFGDRRVIDTPITEHGFTGIAAGAAMAGLKPILEFMTFNFAMQAIDQIINSAIKSLYMSGGQVKCPIVFRGPNGSSAGVGAQHSQDYSAWFAALPGVKVLSPYDAEDARGLLKAAIRDPNPVIFLENEMMYSEAFEVSDETLDKEFVLPIGKAKIQREGTDLTIVTYSKMVGMSVRAAEQLQKEFGISVEVVNLRSLRPVDEESIVKSVMKTHRLLTVDETWPTCGWGAEIMAIVSESEAYHYLDQPMERLTAADCPLPYAKGMEDAALPKEHNIVTAVKRMLRK